MWIAQALAAAAQNGAWRTPEPAAFAVAMSQRLMTELVPAT
ncbi:hypothetical protein FrEUN1fDRAFT_0392 [Parafrankia sp. EUN1f]|nr:hypothetical protein FrEUN1fDRAFT_0392 [Parafrankia sp. EUN1f]